MRHMDLGNTVSTKRRYISVLLVLFVVFFFGRNLLSSYTTAYEGAKARFYGVELQPGWSPEIKFYNIPDPYPGETRFTNYQRWHASAARFDSTMKFDPDSSTQFMCNLDGEMTSIFVPLGEKTAIPPDWVPSTFWRDSASWQNPVKTWVWDVQNSDGTTTRYVMEKWLTKWYVSIASDWDSGPSLFDGRDEAQNRRFRDAEIWVEFDIRPVWYFEANPNRTYFAIAKVELANYKEGSIDSTHRWSDEQFDDMRTTPESPGSILTLYTSPFGDDSLPSDDHFVAYYYSGSKLNPLYFRDKVYAHFDLNNFGSSEKGTISLVAKGDAVTMGFTVTQFVVGEWTVKDVNDIPFDEYGKHTKIERGGAIWLGDLFKWIADGINNPLTWIGLAVFGFLLIMGLAALGMFWFTGMPRKRE